MFPEHVSQSLLVWVQIAGLAYECLVMFTCQKADLRQYKHVTQRALGVTFAMLLLLLILYYFYCFTTAK